MLTGQRLRAGMGILKSRTLGWRVPVAIRWNLLNRCHSQCKYCNLWKTKTDELSFEEIADLIKQFRKLGTVIISFSGGEPLLRENIGGIITECKHNGIIATINTSGFGLEQKIDDLHDLSLIKISLDGPEEIHDAVRGRASAYKTAIAAAEIAKGRIEHISFTTTITRYNVNHLSRVIDIAKPFKATVAFQPVKEIYCGVDNIDEMAPSEDDMKTAIGQLIKMKRKGNPYILNTLPELETLSHWPMHSKRACSAGKIFVMINPDGTLLPCDRIGYSQELPNLREMSAAEAMTKLPDIHCKGCGFIGAQRLNSLYALEKSAIMNAITSNNE